MATYLQLIVSPSAHKLNNPLPRQYRENTIVKAANMLAKQLPCALLILTMGFAATKISAQEVEEVIIQATQTEEVALDDLVSASVLDAEKLADAGIENVEDVAAYVPNLVLSETDTGTNIVIRGIGAGVNQGFDQSVGLFIDGVPLPRGQMARAPFLDLAGVQVLRGPQYVKDGNYSIAGSVHLLTKTGEQEIAAQVSGAYVPSQNDRKILLTFGAPLADWATARFAIQRQKSDGYIENVTRNESGPQKDELLFRSVFMLLPTDNLSIKLKVETGSFDTTGRQIEIIESQPTPDYRLFPETIANGGLRSPYPGNSFSGLGSTYRNEIDYALIPLRTQYDRPLLDSPDTPYFAGRSYLQVLADLYTDTAPYGQAIVSGGTSFATAGLGPMPAPAGLLDSKIDFKRGADAAERSENDTVNITTNFDWWLGEHQLSLVASYIKYEVDELIDSDFTAAPGLETLQSEEYSQDFFNFDYSSPKGGFLEWSFGLMRATSELEFIENFNINIDGARGQAEADIVLSGDFPIATNIAFNPETPYRAYFGRFAPAFVRALRTYVPSRNFTQEAETNAAYFESVLNFSDSVRANLGFRYTHSDKQAVRDFAYLLHDGSIYDVPVGAPGSPTARIAGREFLSTLLMGAIFNFQEHTNRKPEDVGRVLSNLPALGADPSDPGQGKRREEKLLPAITFEWDVSNDLSLRMAVRKANKLGGFDARSTSRPDAAAQFGVQPGTFEFEDEDATTYELGALWYLPDGYGQINSTLFYTDYTNLQVSAADRGVGFNVRNAGAARTLGVEIEGLLALTDRFNINYSLAWIDFKFTDYPLANCYLGERPDSLLISDRSADIAAKWPLGTILPIIYEEAETFAPPNSSGFGSIPINPTQLDPSGNFSAIQRFDWRQSFWAAFCDFEGKTNQYVAEWQGTFSLNYSTELNGALLMNPTLDILYNSGYETTTVQDPDVAQDRYVQLNGRLGFSSLNDNWEVALNIENITNEKIVLFANELPLATRLQASKSYYGFVRPPRSVGLSFKYSFF